MNGVSLFANVGIAEILFKEVGIEIKVANEIDLKRANFYSAVHPHTEMIQGDFTKKKIFDDILTKSKKSDIDLVIATPPCQGMSEAGKRNEFDPRNQLISYTIDFIKELKPKYIFIENVPTAIKTKIKINNKILLIPDFIRAELDQSYDINEDTLVSAMDHGVPQMRKRSIFLMTRKDLKLKWNFPQKERKITLQEAIGHLPEIDPYLREGIDFTLMKFPKFLKKKKVATNISKWNLPPTHSWKQVEWMMHTPSGKSAIYNSQFFPVKEDGSKIKAHHNNYRRMHWDKPSRTMTQNNGVISSLCCVHPGRKRNIGANSIFSDPRVLTIYELMIISTIPTNWNIPDWATDSFIRKVIGEGIPPLLVKKIMANIVNK